MKLQLLKIALGIILSNLVAGVVNIVGTICPYLSSYFHASDNSIHSDEVLVTSVIAYILESISFLFLAYLATMFQEIDLIIGSVAICGSLLVLSSYITSPYIFFLIYGFSIGTISTFLSYLPVWIGWKCVSKERQGFIAGLSGSSYVLSPYIFGLIFTFIVNPGNLPVIPSDHSEDLFAVEVYSKVPSALFWVAICILAFGSISSALLYKRFPITTKNTSNNSLTLKALLKQSSFWYIFVLLFYKIFYYLFILSVYKILGLAFINDDLKISMISTIGFVLSAVFKICSGLLLDLYPWTKLNIICVIMEFFLCTLFPLAFDNLFLFAIFFSLSIALASCNFTSIWILSTTIYPDHKWVLSIINICLIFDMLLVKLILTYMLPIIGFTGIFLLTSLSHIMTLILILYKDRLCKPYKPSPLLA